MDNKKKWLNEFISKFRKKYNLLSPELKEAFVSSLDDFKPNCQLELIETIEPNYQILIVTHFEDEEDLSFTLREPVQFKNLVNKLDNILKEGKWDKIISTDIVYSMYGKPSESELYFRKYLEFYFIQLSQDPNNLFQQNWRNTPSIISKSRLVQHEKSRDFAWVIYGDLSKMDQERIIEKMIREANEWLKQKNSSLPPEPNKLFGFFTYFFPPIWVGELPNFQEQVEKSTKLHRKKVLSIEYKDNDLIVYKDGGIAITEEDIDKALVKLNLIMLVSR